MRGKKSPMIMGLIGAMLLSTNAFAAVPSDFSDFPTDWSAPAMTHAVQNGLLNGSDGKILPKGLLTRAQMATMVNRAFASSAKASLTSFTDMVPGVWHYDEMAKSVQMGAFQGADGKLNPNDPITREQAFAVLARAFGLADGKASSLDKFSDGAQVSSWAKGAVAALVEQGYVTGADGALNPQSYITRAEFAQVMDALVAAYGDQDLKDQTVEGNLILRSNSTLENVTVKGDLILADGVSAASLKNVTVTGRLVVRGGTDGVKLTKSTAKGGIQLANPNGTPKVTVDGKAYNPNGTTNGGNTSGGSGGGSSGGSSSSGSSSGGNSSTTQGTIVKANKTEVIATDAGTWLPLVFETGYTKDNTTVTVDGQDVTTYVTNVTTEGTVAKLPLVGQPGTVTLTSKGKTQTITIGTAPADGKSAVYTGEDYLPDYYLAHGPVALWDYYLTNYDDSGNARVHAERTTFDTTAAKNEHPSYSPVTVLDENGDGNVVIMFNYTTDEDKAWFDGISDYNAEDSEGAVQLASYDQYKQTWNKHLNYTKKTNVSHGTNTVATLNIPFNQTNFTNNGRYYVRVASVVNGKTTYVNVPIHVVNNKAPTINITETPKSGVNLHFRVSDLVYGITDPIEKVTLTKPNGKVETLKKIDDYYLFSQDLFVLYNDTTATNGTNHLDQNGQYKLHVEATGFQDFERTFNVSNANGGKNTTTVAMRSYSIDALSGSTSSISSGDSSSSGSYAISADLLFQSDLLANALILGDLGYANKDTPLIPAADAVLTWVQNTTFDAVFDTGDTMYFDKGDYIAASNPKTWIPFSEYRTLDTVTADVYQPHATKEVLEDGLLGDILDSDVSGKLDYVEATVSKNQEGSNVVLTFDNTNEHVGNYLEKIQSQGLIYLNGDWRELDANYYTIKNNTITFQARCFKVGSNTIQLKAAGYKVQDVTFDYEKVNETGLSLAATVDKETAGKVHIEITNSKGDFLKNLKSITLTKGDEVDQVYHYGYEGGKAVYYVVAEDNKSVDLYNVTTPGQYTVNIKANYYDEAGLSAGFTVAGTVELKPVPNENPTVSLSDTIYKLNFGSERTTKDWQDKVTSVTVNGNEYTKCGTYSSLTSNGYKLGDITGYSSVELWIEGSAFTAVNKLDIQADGYETLTLKINKNGSLVTDGEVTPPATVTVPTAAPEVTKDSSFMPTYYQFKFGDSTKAWLEKISGVTVNGEAYSLTSYSVYGSYYKVDVENNAIQIGVSSFNSNRSSTVILSATGCDDLKVKVKTDLTATIVDDSAEKINAPQYKKWDNSSNKLEFKSSEETINYIDAITEVQINGTALSEASFYPSFGEFVRNLTSSDTSLKFSSNNFSSTENTTIIIIADGYNKFTLVIDADGQVVTGGDEAPGSGNGDISVPTTVSISKEKLSSGTDYHMLSFGGSGAWLDKVTKVKVGNDFYNESSNLGTKMWNKDITNNTVSIMFPSELWSTTYAVTFMTDEEGVLLKLSVVIPGFSGTPTVEITE